MKVDFPAFPSEVLGALERVVELTDVEAVADRIENMLREVQVLSARTRPLVKGAEINPIDLQVVSQFELPPVFCRGRALRGLVPSRRS